MKRSHLMMLATALVAALVFAATAFSGSSATPTLKGVVGPGFTISLKKSGTKVKTLKAGKYKLVISDKSSFHNFTLEREKPSKPKIEKHLTGTGFTGRKTLVVTLRAGRWRVYCSVPGHEAQMHQDFTVKR